VFDSIQSPEASTYTAEPDAPPTAVNTTTKAELLNRAKAAIEDSEQSLHDAAEALGLAQEDHSATQREMAEAIGKSASWVNKLLKWRRSGYNDHSPFGPTTKRGRVEHAQQRAKPSKARKPRDLDAIASAHADDAHAGAERYRDDYTDKKAKTSPSTVTSPLDGFKSAVDYWFSMMDCDAKREAASYAKSRVRCRV
jgi:hypothetical protein